MGSACQDMHVLAFICKSKMTLKNLLVFGNTPGFCTPELYTINMICINAYKFVSMQDAP